MIYNNLSFESFYEGADMRAHSTKQLKNSSDKQPDLEKFLLWSERLHGEAPNSIIQQVKQGLDSALFCGAISHFALTKAELGKILGMSAATIHRKSKAGTKLDILASERLARIAILEKQAAEVFGSAELALAWLKAPNLLLEQQTPLQLLDTDIGCAQVRRLLMSIAYGGVA